MTRRLFLGAIAGCGLQHGLGAADGLPNVLLIGDSISIGYTPFVRELLRGRANVLRPMQPDGKRTINCFSTATALRELPKWLGSTGWDVIHFNWGLHDLCYRDWTKPRSETNRDKVHGTMEVPLKDYAPNLDRLVSELKKTGAKLIWASTTKVPAEEIGRVQGDEIRYNEAAKQVMARQHVPIDDLYAVSAQFPPEFSLAPGNVHYTPEGYRRLAEHVSESIRKYLR